jgi:hypothetical protein
MPKKLGTSKHSSLFCFFFNGEQKSFIISTTMLLMPQTLKVECLYLAILFRIFASKARPYSSLFCFFRIDEEKSFIAKLQTNKL